jgi:hypothetical protein
MRHFMTFLPKPVKSHRLRCLVRLFVLFSLIPSVQKSIPHLSHSPPTNFPYTTSSSFLNHKHPHSITIQQQQP